MSRHGGHWDEQPPAQQDLSNSPLDSPDLDVSPEITDMQGKKHKKKRRQQRAGGLEGQKAAKAADASLSVAKQSSGGSGSGVWSLELKVHMLPRLLQYISTDEEGADAGSAGMGAKKVAGFGQWAQKFGQASLCHGLAMPLPLTLPDVLDCPLICMTSAASRLPTMCPQVVQDLLCYGRGLWVGPDSDGLLNFGDPRDSILSGEDEKVRD